MNKNSKNQNVIGHLATILIATSSLMFQLGCQPDDAIKVPEVKFNSAIKSASTGQQHSQDEDAEPEANAPAHGEVGTKDPTVVDHGTPTLPIAIKPNQNTMPGFAGGILDPITAPSPVESVTVPVLLPTANTRPGSAPNSLPIPSGGATPIAIPQPISAPTPISNPTAGAISDPVSTPAVGSTPVSTPDPGTAPAAEAASGPIAGSAPLTEGTYEIKNAAASLCIDVPNFQTTAGVDLQAYFCNRTSNQIYAFRLVEPDGTYKIINRNSGLTLAAKDTLFFDPDGRFGGRGERSIILEQANDSNDPNQLFRIIAVPNSTNFILKLKNLDVAVDILSATAVDFDPIKLTKTNGGPTQQWTLNAVP